MVKRKRTVYLTGKCPTLGTTKLWAFGFADLGELLGLEVEEVRKKVREGELDPGDLESICKAWLEHHLGSGLEPLRDWLNKHTGVTPETPPPPKANPLDMVAGRIKPETPASPPPETPASPPPPPPEEDDVPKPPRRSFAISPRLG